MCPSPDPVFSDRYYQYNLKVESEDSFDKILLWYNTPDDDGDDALAPNGWGAWLRPGAKKVFVEMTDDNEDMTATQFIDRAHRAFRPNTSARPSDPTFTFHTIMGIKEKAVPTDAYLPTEPIELATCTGNGADIVNAGPNVSGAQHRDGRASFPALSVSRLRRGLQPHCRGRHRDEQRRSATSRSRRRPPAKSSTSRRSPSTSSPAT